LLPSAEVLAEFGAAGQPQPLAGGQRTVWRVGDVVLKRLDGAPDMVQWQAGVLGRVGATAGVRVAPPLASVTGGWVVQGWTAWRYLAGRPAGKDWRTIMAAGRALHVDLQNEDRPDLLDDRDDVWARADRAVWDLAVGPPHPELRAAFEARRPVGLLDQLVHGDLTGNVLVDDTGVPAVVDFSPYWRPASWATAVVCADAMLFADADAGSVLAAADAETGNAPCGQVLLRAVLFRLVTGVLAGRPLGDNPTQARVLNQVASRAASDW
jgi:uncharacterized protein (TIGR02569 family)